MSSLDAALGRALTAPGISGAMLLDAVTGLSYAESGDVSGSQDSCEIAEIARTRLNRAGAPGELENVIVTTSTRHLVTLQLPRRGDPLLLCATVDRERTNLTWALRELHRHADELLA
ncbi:hypothetical protein R6V09_22295 [Streptomyces sp. W16]|uniref:hypothetical protein n=1 Tax=Streptomyces sp. W16 TaxID=3076631 RepID=UPI00295B291B|nr:hypothetical protein [Streptomyces sp. W16]MDV9172832.1 hypothetical protein [Streptomyces sp. W16]